MTDAIKKKYDAYIKTYLFTKAWNLPEYEYRHNIIIDTVSTVPLANICVLDHFSVELPTKNTLYYVYRFPRRFLQNIKLDLTTWTALVDVYNSETGENTGIVNETKLDIRLTDVRGYWLWRANVFLVNYPCGPDILVAVDANMLKSILGTDGDKSKLYLSIYLDSDVAGDRTVVCMNIKTIQQKQVMYEVCTKSEWTVQYVFRNGKEMTTISSPDDFKIGDYIEMIDDPDVIADIKINLNDATQNRYYKSKKNGLFNYIVHIPKEDNPDNYLITHNTCDVFVRSNKDPKVGLFVHRYNTIKDIIQITHNDFAISTRLVESYMASLDTTEATLRVLVRRHNKTAKLLNEANYINQLYKLTDTEILDALEGKLDGRLYFWKAENLDQSLYPEYMLALPDAISKYTTDKYVKMLGFYNSMAVLCRRIYRFTLDTSYKTESNYYAFSINVSYCFTDTNLVITPIIMYDGIVLDETEYAFTKSTVSGVYDVVIFKVADENKHAVVLELYENPNEYVTYVTPSSTIPQFTLNNATEEDKDELSVYKCIPLTTTEYLNSNILTDRVKEDIQYAYLDVTNDTTKYTLSVSEENKLVITFSNTVYGTKFLICKDRKLQCIYNNTFTLASVANKAITTGPLYYTAGDLIDNNKTNSFVPVLKDSYFIVFLNGKKLVENVDYVVIDNKTNFDHICYKSININNMSYLEDTNILKIYVSSDKQFKKTNGFIKEKKIVSNNFLLYWYDTLSSLCADGAEVDKLDSSTTPSTIIVNSEALDIRNGALYGTCSTSPMLIYDYLSEMTTEETNIDVCDRIIDYLRGKYPTTYDTQIINNSHHLYSIIMTEIIDAVVKKTLVLEDKDNLLEQVEDYIALKDQDGVMLGTIHDLQVYGSDVSAINGTYKLTNKVSIGCARVWKNEYYMMVYNIDSLYWEIKLNKNSSYVYRAYDPTGDDDPWKLKWESEESTEHTDIIIYTGNIDLKFTDINKTYKEASIPVTQYNLVMRIFDLIKPTDISEDVNDIIM